MSLPPWHGIEEPDFLPDIRRQFADYLPGRMQRAREALDLIALTPGEFRSYLDDLFTVVHDLSGTASSLGGVELGEVAKRVAAAVRPWTKSDSPPDALDIEEVDTVLKELEARSSEFLGWMDVDPEA